MYQHVRHVDNSTTSFWQAQDISISQLYSIRVTSYMNYNGDKSSEGQPVRMMCYTSHFT